MTTTAELSAGGVAGRRVSAGLSSVVHFSRVPYAAPPVGERRFAAPGPLDGWSGVRDASEPGPAPPQIVPSDEVVPGMAVSATSEDCLTAEVWTPSLDGRRPVLVWIPGGRYQIGGASLPTYDGRRLALEGDLVVIGLNYRLGALGFLCGEGVPANLGLRDLLAALQFIRSEVEAFGGDPRRIVVMGESAGAGAITHLLTRPELAELVSGAIVQSAAPAATLDLDTAAMVASTVLAAAGADSVAELRRLPLPQLLAAQHSASSELLASVGMMPLHPVVDGDVVPTGPMDAARAGTLAAIPLVLGTNDNEMELFRGDVPVLPTEIAVPFLRQKLTPVLGTPPTAEAVARGLDAVGGDLVEAVADVDLHVPADLLAAAHAARGIPTWRYRFGWSAPHIGAAHALDLPFTFGTLDVDEWRTFAGAHDPEADRLSDRLRSAWTSFCHHGTPSCDPLGPWPPLRPGGTTVVHLGRDVDVVDDPGRHRTAAWTGGP